MMRLASIALFALLAAAPAVAAEVPADQVFVEKHITIRWSHDGRQTTRVRTARRLLTDYAVRRLADPRIRYDEDLQDLTIHSHEVRTPGGDVVVAPAYARNLSQADGLGNTTDFASVVELVATQVGAQRGAVLILDYELSDREAFRPALDLSVALGEADPIDALVVEVTLPDELPLRWAVTPEGAPFDGQEIPAADGLRMVRLTGTDLPGYGRETGGQDPTPRLLVSSWLDWETTLAAARAALVEASADARRCGLPGALTAAGDDHGRAAAIRAVRDGLRVLRGEVPGGMLRLRPVCRAWESGHATPAEVAVLLATWATDTDRVQIHLSTGRQPIVEAVPGMVQWTQVEVGVREAGEQSSLLYIPESKTLQGSKPDHEGIGRVWFNLSSDLGNSKSLRGPRLRRPADFPCWSLDEARTYRTNTTGGIDLELRLELTRRPDVWLDLSAAKDLEDALTARLGALLPGATIGAVSVHRMGPLHLSLETTLTGGAAPGPGTTVPLGVVFPAPQDLAALVGVETRRSPLPLELCTEVTQTLRFEGLDAVGLVPLEAAAAPAPPGHPITRSRWTDDHGFVRTLRGAETVISPGDWPTVRAELRAWLQDQSRRLLLLPPAEARQE